MEPVDYVSIVLGILLLGLIIGIIVAVLLIKKGIIFVNIKQKKVRPELLRPLSRASSLNTSLYRQIPDVIRTKQSESPRSYTEKKPLDDTGPIIYLQDDIYHPPGSLPLPPFGKVTFDGTHSFYGIYKQDPGRYKSRARQGAPPQSMGGRYEYKNGGLPQDDGICSITAFGRCDPYCDVNDRDRKHSVI